MAIDQACKSAMARRAREREEDERQTAEMVKAWRAKNKEIDDEAEADEKRRHDELMDLKKTQYEQREQYRARVRQERADRLSGDTGEANRILQEDLEFRQEAQREIDKAKAAGRPWYMLQKAKEAKERALFPSGGSGKAARCLSSFLARRRASLRLRCVAQRLRMRPSPAPGLVDATRRGPAGHRLASTWAEPNPRFAVAYGGEPPRPPRPRRSSLKSRFLAAARVDACDVAACSGDAR